MASRTTSRLRLILIEPALALAGLDGFYSQRNGLFQFILDSLVLSSTKMRRLYNRMTLVGGASSLVMSLGR